MARVLVTGAYGLLGSTLCPFLTEAGHEVMRQGRRRNADYRADPAYEGGFEKLLDLLQPEITINLIAATDVEACEADPQLAYLANVLPVEALARYLRRTDVHLIHISTDQVYGGPGLHAEDKVCPANVYGLSKLAGEMAAASVGATILRTNFVGKSRASGRVSFTDWVVNSLRGQQPIILFEDVLFSALHAADLCRFIELTIRLKPPGIFNVGCADGLSKARFAFGLAERLGLDTTQVKVGRLADVELSAKRPFDMRLDVQRFAQVCGAASPSMEQTLDLVAKDYDHA